MIAAEHMTIAEFDAWLETADDAFRYELHHGSVYAFATGTEEHGLLCTRIGAWLYSLAADPAASTSGPSRYGAGPSVRRR